MLPDNLSTALKEWAVVQRALLEGHQIVLLRKGGLIEESGDFDLKARDFLLYPTFEHETERAGDIQPCFSTWLAEEEARNPGPDRARIEVAAHVTDILRVHNRAKLIDFSAQHIWSRQFIDARFDWEPYKPIFLLIVQAWRLSQPATIPVRREYGGCRSWLELAEPIVASGASPAVSDTSFERRRELTLSFFAK